MAPVTSCVPPIGRSDAQDADAFAALAEPHRRALQLHCYRMLGSYEDSEDLVQETLLRAWRARHGFEAEGPSSFRAWLYRIATNACIDVRRHRRVLPYQLEPSSFPATALPAREDVPWLQPFPDALLEGRADTPLGGAQLNATATVAGRFS